MIALVRQFIVDAAPGDLTEDTFLLEMLDSSIGMIVAELMAETEYRHLKSRALTYVSGQELYRWAVFAERMVSAERTDLTPREKREPVRWSSRFSLLSSSKYSEQYYLQGTKLGIVPAPGSGTLTVYSVGVPPALHYGAPQAGGASSITLATTATRGDVITIDDYYNEMPIKIDSGPGAGETNIITDYVGSTKVATVGFAWGTTPTTASVYGLCPPIPEAFHLLPVLMASAMAIEGIQKNPSTYSARAEYMLQKLLSYLSVLDDEDIDNRMVKSTAWE